MGIVRFALRFPHTFYVLAALILFLGVTAIRATPTDIFPEIRIPVVTVIWSYTGLSTPEMEQRVTTYSEYAMSSSVSGIKNIEAQTFTGISVQKVYFQPDVNVDLADAENVAFLDAIDDVELAGFDPSAVTSDSLVALAYLTLVGSLVAFTAYAWVLHHAPLPLIATYAFVNPVVAVILGSIVLNETITPLQVVAGSVIVVGVALIILSRSRMASAHEDVRPVPAGARDSEKVQPTPA